MERYPNRYKKGFTPWNATPWTCEADEWLKNNTYLSCAELVDEISKRFFPVTKAAVYNRLNKLGLKKVHPCYKIRYFTAEQKQFICDRYNNKNMTIREIAKAFSEKYFDISFDAIRNFLHKIGTVKVSGRDYPHNSPKHPIGTISRCGEYGEKLCIKIADKKGGRNNHHSISAANWMPYDKYVYEKEHGIKVDKDSVILHLDGDMDNCAIENLYVIPREHLARLYLNKLVSTDVEVTKAGVMTIELFYALKERGINV